MDREELLTQRLLKTNEKLLEALDNLDPKDVNYWKNLQC